MGAPARNVAQRADGPAGADGQRDSVDGDAGGGAPSMSVARRVLAEVFGFEAFRPGQEAAIEALLAGRGEGRAGASQYGGAFPAPRGVRPPYQGPDAATVSGSRTVRRSGRRGSAAWERRHGP